MNVTRVFLSAALSLGLIVTMAMPAWTAPIILDDIVRVTDTTADNEDGLKSLSVECPSGMSVISGGISVNTVSPVGKVLAIGISEPLDLPSQGWFGYAFETIPEEGTWDLKVTAVCADTSDVLRVASESEISSSSGKNHAVNCPEGLEALGGGFSINGPFLATNLGAVGSTVETGGSFFGTAWRARATEILPGVSDWSLEVTALCGELGNRNGIITSFVNLPEAGPRIKQRLSCPLDQVQISPSGMRSSGIFDPTLVLKELSAEFSTETDVVIEGQGTGTGNLSLNSAIRCLELAIFVDGFESGDPLAWSSAVN